MFDPENLPDHPEVPDLNTGQWAYVNDPDSGAVVPAFVTYGLVITHPDYDPNYVTTGLPGKWVVVPAIAGGPGPLGMFTWAWIPTPPTGGGAPPETGDRPEVNPLPKK